MNKLSFVEKIGLYFNYYIHDIMKILYNKIGERHTYGLPM